MDKDYRQLWEAAADSTDKIKAVRCLAKILAKDKERHFISDVGKEGAELCIDILNYVSCYLFLSPFDASDGLCQALENLALSSREMNRFLNAVRRLSDHYVISPCHVVVLHDLRVSDEVLASGGFGDVRAGWYKERRVAVKTAKVKPTDNLEKKTKVSNNTMTTLRPPPAIWSQPLSSSNFTRRSFYGAGYPTRTS